MTATATPKAQPAFPLTSALELAILRYFHNRNRQGRGGYKWDKQADLEAIDRATPRNFRFDAAAGTFFFTKTTKRQRRVYRTNDERFPDFTVEVSQRRD